MLKLWIAFLSWFVVLAIVIEPANSEPGTIGTGLPRLGIETSSKRVFLGQDRTVALQVIGADATLIYPLAQALVSDELDDANSLVDGLVLLVGSLAFVLVGQHARSLPRLSCNVLLDDLTTHVACRAVEGRT